ncbi:pyridoxamine 5'-phosphate oxidase family protein [Arthrobacter sp. Br18]|uniref:pyridoxamine 5'-phosphate oxidase family protein n=1 Tax=Arthrobacter sp. Br18 TaxID=1312954 RepID=UPI00047B670C|nr:pyridoxamine 5'-phosphate oxidase family protein [Arthrobacter sp. Br18]
MEAETTPPSVLQPHTCWELLRHAPYGRLALCDDGTPDIFPINFAIDHGTIVFRTAEGSKQRNAENASVAFEADGVDGDGIRAWSVVIKGEAATIQRTTELLSTIQLPLNAWQPGRKDRFVRIVPTSITGRSFDIEPSSQTPAATSAHDE